MEVRSESFNTSTVQRLPVSSPQPLQNMRMTFMPDGTAVYRPAVTSGTVTGGGDGTQLAAEPVKRKRGRPRKYGPDGPMSGGLAAAASPPRSATVISPLSGVAVTGTQSQSPVAVVKPISVTGSADGEVKKARGRPAGSGKKMQMDALGSGGIGFTPHVITVKAGEDVSSKIMSFSQHGPRSVCILSANGAISNVTLRQAATSGGTVTYEGRFEILSLSGSFLLSDNGGQRSRTGGLGVSLAGPDGRVLGGGVAGLLTAASPVQVVVGSFIADGRKEPKPMSPADQSTTAGKFASSGVTGASSPPSRGTMSESSGGPGSPLNHNNGNQQGLSSMPWK